LSWLTFLVWAELEQGGPSHVYDLCRPACTRTLEGLDCALMITLSLEQQAEVARALRVTALVGSAVGILGCCPVAVSLEQHAEVIRACGVAAFVGSPVRLLCRGDVTLLLEHCAQVARADRVTALVRTPVGLDRPGRVTALLEQHPEIARRAAITIPVGSSERLLCADAVALLEEQRAEVEGRSRMVTFHGSSERLLGPGAIALLRQQDAELERRFGMPTLIGATERILGAHAVSFLSQKQTKPECGRTLLVIRARVLARPRGGFFRALSQSHRDRGVLGDVRTQSVDRRSYIRGIIAGGLRRLSAGPTAERSASAPELHRKEAEQQRHDDDDPEQRESAARTPCPLWPPLGHVPWRARGSSGRRTQGAASSRPRRPHLVPPGVSRTDMNAP
jgi:hypothetical protein